MRDCPVGVSNELMTHAFTHNGLDEVRMVAPLEVKPKGSPLAADLHYELRDAYGAQVVRRLLFGLPDDNREAGPNGAFATTRLTRGACPAQPPASVFLHAINGCRPVALKVEGRTVGVLYEDATARYCLLGGLCPEETDSPRRRQAEGMFALMEAGLHQAGMDFHNVVRTWFYLDRILEWYGEFNAVRSAFFTKRGVFDRLVPASTGVGMGNTDGAALMAEVLAVAPKDPRLHIQAVPSPLQCPALAYGSSFSRAVELAGPGQKRLLISGTASIAMGGANVHLDDPIAQTEYTLEVIEAILQSRDMSWGDVCQAVAYVKRQDDMAALRTLTTERMPGAPLSVVHADVCRDELLYELEVDAVQIS